MCDEKWILYNKRQWPAQWLDRTEKKLQSTSQSQTCTKKKKKKVLVTVWWSAAHLIHYSFLNPGETVTCEKYSQQIEGMHRSWSQHWPTEWAQFSAIPDHMSHNQCFKRWMNWAMKFCLMRHIHLTSRQPTATSSNISTTFCRENASRTSRRQKMLSKSSLNPEAQIFMLQE